MQWFDIVVVGRCYLHVFVYHAHLSVCPLCSHLSPYLTFLFLKLRKIKQGITYVHFLIFNSSDTFIALQNKYFTNK